jgi:hypothetical protein
MGADSGSGESKVIPKMMPDIPVNIDHLPEEEEQRIIQKIIEARRLSSQQLEKTAQEALNDAINRAKNTQENILSLNIAMFYFGVLLVTIAVIVGIVNGDAGYSIVFGGIGLVQIIASFFVGSMERSQKAISDLVQIEIAYLSYFEQVNLWELYAGILDINSRIDRTNLEKAAEKIQACTRETIELLQTNVEVKETA